MVVEFFLSMWSAFSDWLLGLVPADAVAVPAEVSSLDSTVNSFVANFGGVGVWAPWPLMFVCATLGLAVWAVGWLVKAVAWLWGQVPAIGGSG